MQIRACVNAMKQDEAPRVFISYSRAEWRHVQDLAKKLRHFGVKTWVDIENLKPGDHWKNAISEALDSSRAMIFCVSPLSIDSPWTSRELQSAEARGLTIIPVILEPVPIEQLPPQLAEVQIYDMSKYPQQFAAMATAREISKTLGISLPDEEGWKPGNLDAYDALVVVFGESSTPIPENTIHKICPITISTTKRRHVSSIEASDLSDLLTDMLLARWTVLVVSANASRNEANLLIGASAAQLKFSRLAVLEYESSEPSLAANCEAARARYEMLLNS